MEQRNELFSGTVSLDEDLLRTAYSGLQSQFDDLFGGFGGAPEFPLGLITTNSFALITIPTECRGHFELARLVAFDGRGRHDRGGLVLNRVSRLF